MPDIGAASWIAIAAVAGALVVLAVLHFGFHVFRRKRVRRPARHTEIASLGRVEVLETTPIDAERKLVLVRCDGIEHLIMVGGPADVVVENDVKKVRGPGVSSPARATVPEPEKRQRVPPAPVPTASAAPAPALPKPAAPKPAAPKPSAAKPPETNRPAARASTTEARPSTSTQRTGLATVTPSSTRNTARASDPPPAAGKAEEPAWTRAPAARPQGDSQFGRRDATPRRANAQAAPLSAPRPEPARPQTGTLGSGRIGRSGTRAADDSTSLPAAQIPWSDPDSIENEIVRALKFDPQIRGSDAGAARREAASIKPIVDSHTTLGDLADRLEEALAREVQSARSINLDPEEFTFDNDEMAKLGPPLEPPQAERERPEKRERSEAPRIETSRGAASAPEPEARRETPPASERREEAPVISLNSRRRESADPLEDEMARLLGELTSDSKGR